MVAGALPGPYKVAGIVLALAGAVLLSLQPEPAVVSAEAS
jgi:drug/metabolite transporter (DMT)-like permease